MAVLEAPVWYSRRLFSPAFVCVLVYHIWCTRNSNKWQSTFRLSVHVAELTVNQVVCYTLAETWYRAADKATGGLKVQRCYIVNVWQTCYRIYVQ
jgi:hypothetical protein